jgi:CCR4-NOT transcription complex subunit 7/8
MSYLIPNQIENNQINPFIESDPSMIDSSHILPRLSSSIINNSKLESKIIDVYEENFINEIKRIGTYLKQYTYIGMDTEFPGIVFPCPTNNSDFYYQYIKANVDKLNLIQLGITLTNSKGERPPNTSTWQFNLKFDKDKENHSTESISLLENCGINFFRTKNEGIPYDLFGEYLTTSDMVLNENITWISFNGLSDFAYLLKALTGDLLPDTVEEFLDLLKLYFPNAYDIKYLINENEAYKGGLNKISKELNIERHGEVHQAGSDSLVTSQVFLKLIENNSININDLNFGKNILFGIGEGADDAETFSYTKFAPGLDMSFLFHNINNNINIKRQNGNNNMNNNNRQNY